MIQEAKTHRELQAFFEAAALCLGEKSLLKMLPECSQRVPLLVYFCQVLINRAVVPLLTAKLGLLNNSP